MLNLYLYNLPLVLLIMIPASLVYASRALVQPVYYLLSTLGILTIPAIPIVFATGVSLLIDMFSNKFRGKNLISILLNVALLFGIMTISFSMQRINPEQLVQLADFLMTQINRIYPLAGWYVRAITEPNLSLFLAFFLLSWSFFTGLGFLIARFYPVLKERLSNNGQHSIYHGQTLKQSTLLKALYKKELKFYFSSGIYVMNTALGSLMMVATAVMIFLQKDQILPIIPLLPGGMERVQAFIPIGIAFFAGLTCTTAVSLSLEGSMFPLLKSWPMDPMTFFWSKILVNLTIFFPAIILTLPIVAFIFPLAWSTWLFALLIPGLAGIAIAQAGILINLLFPKFDWVNHTAMVKQSMASFSAVFGGLAFMILISLPVFMMTEQKPYITLLITTLVLLAFNYGFYRLLNGWGRTTFSRIGQ